MENSSKEAEKPGRDFQGLLSILAEYARLIYQVSIRKLTIDVYIE
jgi:hypothetical protein